MLNWSMLNNGFIDGMQAVTMLMFMEALDFNSQYE